MPAFIPLVAGTTYGKLTVLGEAPRKNGRRIALCRCECGRETLPGVESLRSGKSRSCGCLMLEAQPRINLPTGMRLGCLTVEAMAGARDRQTQVSVRCVCGKALVLSASHFKRGHHHSCGCQKGARRRTHGHMSAGPSPEYQSWRAMRARCNNPNNKSFPYYGGRGIKVCERWEKFENFLADMGSRPPSLTLDRIDGRLGYFPGNCRWASRGEQTRNRGASSLDVEKVATIKRLLAEGLKQGRVAKLFGVSRSAVNHVATGKTWAEANGDAR